MKHFRAPLSGVLAVCRAVDSNHRATSQIGRDRAWRGFGWVGALLAAAVASAPAFADFAYRDAVLADSPIAYWRLGEGGGTASDSSGTGHDGTYQGGVMPVPGALLGDDDQATQFNGGRVDVGSDLGTFSQLTVEMWIREQSLSYNFPRLFVNTRGNASITIAESTGGDTGGQSDTGLLFRLTSNGKWTTLTGVPGILNGSWQHFAFVWDGALMHLFRNGLEVTLPVAFTGPLDPAIPAILPTIGGETPEHGDGLGSFFNGQLDEIAVYDTALSYERINAHYVLGHTDQPVRLTISPRNIDFGTVPRASPEISRTATVTNVSASAVTITSLAPSTDRFRLDLASSTCPQPPATLDSGASCMVTVVMTTALPFSASDSLQIVDDATDSPQGNTLSGMVTEPYTGCPSISGQAAFFSRDRSPLTITCNLTINPQDSLSIEPGVELRIANGSFLTVQGGLYIHGSPAAPVRLTSSDGTAETRWGGILFQNGSIGTLSSATIEFAGQGTSFGLRLAGRTAFSMNAVDVRQVSGSGIIYQGNAFHGSFSHGSVSDVTGTGILLSSDACPRITDTSVTNSGDYGVSLSNLQCDPDLTGLTLTGTGHSNHIFQLAGDLASGESRTIRNRNYIYDVPGNVTVMPGATLAIEAGSRLWMTNSVDVRGTFNATGTSAAPITLTSSDGTPGTRWGPLYLRDGSSAAMAYVTVENSGQGAIHVATSAASLSNLTIRQVAGAGIKFQGTAVRGSLSGATISDVSEQGILVNLGACPTITNASVNNSGDYGVLLGDLQCDPDLTGLTLTGTGHSSHIFLAGGTLASGESRTLRNRNYIYDVSGDIGVTPSGTLAIEPGSRLWMTGRIDVQGTLSASGTPAAPITLTSSDGTTGTRWGPLYLRGGSSAAMTYVNLENAGQTGLSIADNLGTSTLDHLTIRNNLGDGIRLYGTNLRISNSNLTGNTPFGINNVGGGIIDARGNWWGDASGPSGSGPGTGDRVSINVLFEPWSTTPIP